MLWGDGTAVLEGRHLLAGLVDIGIWHSLFLSVAPRVNLIQWTRTGALIVRSTSECSSKAGAECHDCDVGRVMVRVGGDEVEWREVVGGRVEAVNTEAFLCQASYLCLSLIETPEQFGIDLLHVLQGTSY